MRASTFLAVALSALLSSAAALPAPRPNAVADSGALGGLLSPVTGALGSAVDNGSGNDASASADGSGNGSGSGNEAGNGNGNGSGSDNEAGNGNGANGNEATGLDGDGGFFTMNSW
ncbi:hypothetical protein D0866_04912 [Hortaea werneckii]|uniref:Uncharacterized protein n=1 Tax=Hortaea werneckii TaxID=91943 RepID=A0A3M7B595_HORWE|nr:hypothetical protein D0866_04912 [Hortaea werneckii]